MKSQNGQSWLHPYLDHAGDGIYVLDSQTGRILNANNRGVQMLGYSLDELLKLSAKDIEVTLSPDAIRDVHSRTRQEIVALEGVHRRKDGSTFPVEMRITSLAPEEPHRVLGVVRDITKRKQAERALRRQAALLDLAHDAIFTLDPKDRITYWNQGAAQRYGWSKEEAVRKVSHVLLHTQFPEPREKILATLMRTGRWEGELVHTCRDGRRITVDSRWAVQRDPEGDGFRILEINNDITERKRTLEELRHQAALLDLAHNAIFTRDPSDRITYWNKGAAERYGWSKEQALGTVVHTLLQTQFPEPFEEIRRTLMRTGRWEGELVHTCRDGQRIAVDSRWAVQRDAKGGGFRILEINNDITERKRAEEALQHQAALLDLAHDAIFTVDSGGHITYWNQGAAQRYGWSKEEAMGEAVRTLLRTQFPEQLGKIIDKLKRTGRWEGEVVHTCRDGRRIPVDSRWALQREAKGDGYRILVINDDITERKRAEEALREEAKRKDEFLALLGHELRNPLAAISTAMQVLTGDLTSGQRSSLTELMGRQVVLMRRLLDDLLDLGRISHGHIELKKECVELAEFLQKAAAAVHSAVANRGQKLRVRLASESVRFMADRTRLEQIATNLLGNASKYTHEGGRIEFSGAREGSEVVLRCKDNGRGIPAEMQRRIFEPFTRGLTPTDSHGEASLGIGLALVKQLAELHGGTISVESAGAGMGSEFTVRLPLVPPPCDQTAVLELKSAPESRRARSIVVVEDNPAVAEVMKTALEQAGHKVHMFANGPSALSGVRGLRPDAVLLDIGLPGMDGYELAAKLKKRRNIRSALFIAISGFKRREQTGKARDDFDHYFTKPVDIRALQALLDTRSRRATAGAANPARKRRKPVKAGRSRVLLVEDHVGLAEATASLLRGAGLEVKTAFTGGEALEAAPSFRPELILCDMNLPDMKGLEVIRSLRSNASSEQAHAVILTAMSETEIRAYNGAVKRLGVDEFMSKPITAEAVRALVSKLKPQRRSSRRTSRDALGSS